LRVAREVKRGKEREESAPGHPFWVTHSSSSIVPVRAVTLSATAIDYTHTSKPGMLRAGGVGSAPSLPGPYYTRCYCARCSLTVRSLQLAGCSSYRDSLIKSSRFEHRCTQHGPHFRNTFDFARGLAPARKYSSRSFACGLRACAERNMRDTPRRAAYQTDTWGRQPASAFR